MSKTVTWNSDLLSLILGWIIVKIPTSSSDVDEIKLQKHIYHIVLETESQNPELITIQ
jgi:hypothetical protein